MVSSCSVLLAWWYSPVSGTVQFSWDSLGDGANGAGALVLHGLPPLQLSGDPPPDALQVQGSVKLPRPQRNTEHLEREKQNQGD